MTALKLVALMVTLGGFVGECAQHGGHTGHAETPAASSSATNVAPEPQSLPGYAPITIDASRVGPLGLASGKVAERDFIKHVRTVGVVALDETRTAHVHAKVKGFVEALPADFVGKTVKRGAILASIYSQTVYGAQLEHLSLLKQPRILLGDDLSKDAEDKTWQRMIDASRRRLLLWDVPKTQIDRLEKTLEPQRTYPIAAPRSGTLVAKQAVLGNYVEPGVELFTISDLSHLWVLVDVYEADAPHVVVGRDVELGIAGEVLQAKITFVPPTIDEATRTLKIRLDVPNANGTLRPGAFATADLSLPLGRGVAIPETAVVRTGKRNIVFVVHALADGSVHVTPREVTLGPLVEAHYRVTAGLQAGDSVATGAQFLIDSESRLRASSGGAPGAHGGH